MVFIQKAYPYVTKKVDSFIGSWLLKNGNLEKIKEFTLMPFDINVQTMERTLIDKVFAICDYYLRKDSLRNSRHIYDISRLLKKVELSELELKNLVEKVRIDRQPNKTCVSAQDGVSIEKVLQEIIDTKFFKKDYENTTDKLLIKPVNYEEAILSIKQIIDSKIFNNND